MKILPISITLLCVFLLTNCDSPTGTTWTDPVSGTKYDFSALKKDPK